MPDRDDELEDARDALSLAKANFERARVNGDTDALRMAQPAYAVAQDALDELEARRAGEEAGRAATLLAQRRTALARRQAIRGETQQSILATLHQLIVEYRQTEEADAADLAENADLSASSMPTAEALWRHRPAMPEEVLSRRVVARWVNPNGIILPPEAEKQITVFDAGRGKLSHQMAGSLIDTPVARQSCTETTFLPALAAFEPPAILSQIQLPNDPAAFSRTPLVRLARTPGLALTDSADGDEDGQAA